MTAYEAKVKELLESRERVITLEAELKMARESADIMKAEFSLQVAEYQAEIESLKQRETELRDALVKAQAANGQHIDVNAYVTVREKYQKLKRTNADLQRDYAHLEERLAHQTPSEDVEAFKREIQEPRSSRDVQEAQFTEAFQKQRQHLKNRVERREQLITQLQAENQRLTRELEDRSAVYDDREHRRLIQKVQRHNGQLQKLKAVTAKNKHFQELLRHYDAQRQVLNDILGAEDLNPELPWSNLRTKAKEGCEAISKLNATTDQLAAAVRRIEDLLREQTGVDELQMRIVALKKKNEQLQQVAQQIARSEQAVREIEAETGRARRFAEQQKVRTRFACSIAAHQKRLIDQISALHYTLTGESDPILRPILLAVVFLHRWRRIASLKSFDPSALVAFASVSDNTVDFKLKTIQDLFLALSNELKATKEPLVEQKGLNRQPRGGEIGMAEVEASRAQIALYKRRIKELVAQNAELVAADRFDEVIRHATDVELENDQLRETIETKQAEIDHHAEVIQTLTRDLAKAQLQHEADQKEAARVAGLLDQRQTQIAVLRTKLHDRTKDLLALERMNDYKPAGAAAAPEDDPSLPLAKINPVFLGVNPNAVQ
jgi:hypothetical protein